MAAAQVINGASTFFTVHSFTVHFLDSIGNGEADAHFGGAVPFVDAVAVAEQAHILGFYGCEAIALHVVGEAAAGDVAGGIGPGLVVHGGLHLEEEHALVAVVEGCIDGIDFLDLFQVEAQPLAGAFLAPACGEVLVVDIAIGVAFL